MTLPLPLPAPTSPLLLTYRVCVQAGASLPRSTPRWAHVPEAEAGEGGGGAGVAGAGGGVEGGEDAPSMRGECSGWVCRAGGWVGGGRGTKGLGCSWGYRVCCGGEGGRGEVYLACGGGPEPQLSITPPREFPFLCLLPLPMCLPLYSCACSVMAVWRMCRGSDEEMSDGEAGAAELAAAGVGAGGALDGFGGSNQRIQVEQIYGWRHPWSEGERANERWVWGEGGVCWGKATPTRHVSEGEPACYHSAVVRVGWEVYVVGWGRGWGCC